jgi:AbrB family looped-hinge helix DNA binding protein
MEVRDMDITASAKLRDKNQLTLPAAVRKALGVQEGDEIEFTVAGDGSIAVRGYTRIPTDQRWFWEREWQLGEREASEQIAAGETTVHDLSNVLFIDPNHSQ